MSDQRYLVTARKYRPNLFHELVAQEHVTETLKNAIRLDRLAHAYLFSGPRGVGKTTAARILAKAINCTAPLDAREDGAEPCRTCDSCRSFEEGRSLSIFEIDAASNRKVEDMQMILDKVRVPPQGSRKKVYIIDEVHMMSAHAFNALLKTLEEPPPHVLFIFATTEPHKVLPTILSRCQRFDFRRIPVPDVVARLQEICAEEDITADEASLMLLARKGDGALRDALSAFDQAVSLCGDDLRYGDLAEALRVVDVDLFFQVTRHVADQSSAGMLRLVDRIVRSGYDLQEFLVGLSEHLRNLLVACTTGETALIEAAEATRRRYAEAAEAFQETDLLRLLMIVDGAEESIKSSTQPRMKLEIALLKMAALGHAVDVREALAQLDRLEAMARDGTLPAVPAAGPAEATPAQTRPAPTSEAREPAPEPPRAEHASKPAGADSENVPSPDPVEATHVHPEAPEDTAEQEPDEPDAARDVVEAEPDDEAVEPDAGRARPEDTTPQEASPSEETAQPPPSYPNLFGPPALQKKTPRDAGSNATAQALFDGSGALKTMAVVEKAAPEPLLAQVTSLWPRYVQAVKAERIHVGALLQHTIPLDLEADALVVGVPDDFHLRLLGSQRDFLLKHLEALAPGDVGQLAFKVHEALEAKAPEAATPEIDPVEYMQRKRQESPVIRALFEQFGGELVW